MLQYEKTFLYSLIILFLGFNTSKTNAQTVFFNSNLDFTPAELSHFLSSVTADENQVYFNANDHMLYVYNKKYFSLKYKKAISRKTNELSYIYKNTLITGIYQDGKHQCAFINKTTGTIEQTLNLPPLKTEPLFVSDSVFFATTLDEEGGQLVSYDVKNNKLLWKQFVGHGMMYPPILQHGKILANFDYDTWKEVTFEGKLEEEIYQEKTETEEERYLADENYKMIEIVAVKERKFFQLTHDQKKMTSAFLYQYFPNLEGLQTKSTATTTVLLTDSNILVLGNNLKVKTHKTLLKLLPLPEYNESEYFALLKIEGTTVWFFYKNRVVNFDFKKNKVVKTYDLTQWNAHQVVLDDNKLWLISKNDGQLYGLQLEMTEKELDEKAAKLKYYECTKPDKTRIEAQKKAEEKLKSKN